MSAVPQTDPSQARTLISFDTNPDRYYHWKLAVDGAFVKSPMQRVTTHGKMASWVAPPERGINNLPVDYEYVHLN